MERRRHQSAAPPAAPRFLPRNQVRYELACLRQASLLGARSSPGRHQRLRGRRFESEIELAFLAACGQREQELPYGHIIALNESGAVLHYQLLEKAPAAERHSLLIDAGAEFAGYACDITRTYSHRDPDFAALIARMDRMQQSLCAAVKPGVDWREIHLQTHRLLAELLQEADIVTCSTDEAVATATTSACSSRTASATCSAWSPRCRRLHALSRRR